MKNKKAQVFEQLGSLGIGVCVLAITLVVTFLILTQSKNNITGTDYCENSSFARSGNDCCLIGAKTCTGVNISGDYSNAVDGVNTLTNATADIPGWVPLIIIAFVGSILLGLVALFRR